MRVSWLPPPARGFLASLGSGFIFAAAWVASCLAYAGQTDSAAAEFYRALQMDSTNSVALSSASLAFAHAGRLKEALVISRRLTLGFEGEREYVLARAGYRSEAMRVLRRMQAARPEPWLNGMHIAFIALGLGDTALALTSLERATDAKEIWPSFRPLLQQLYDPIRHSPRFAALVRRVGLDEKIFTSPDGGRPH